MSWSHARGQLIVAAVCILITFVAYTSQIFVLWSFLGGATLHTLLVLAPFNVFVIMIYINYTLVCLTDPGTVPPNWVKIYKYLYIRQQIGILTTCVFIDARSQSSHGGETLDACAAVLQNVQKLQTSTNTSLQQLPEMCAKDGSSLPLHKQLRWLRKLRSLYPLHCLRWR